MTLLSEVMKPFERPLLADCTQYAETRPNTMSKG